MPKHHNAVHFIADLIIGSVSSDEDYEQLVDAARRVLTGDVDQELFRTLSQAFEIFADVDVTEYSPEPRLLSAMFAAAASDDANERMRFGNTYIETFGTYW